jgi:hypothetical protein
MDQFLRFLRFSFELVASFIIEPQKLINVYANHIERLIRLNRDKTQMSRFGKRVGLIHPEFGG